MDRINGRLGDEVVKHNIQYRRQNKKCVAYFQVSKKYENLEFKAKGGSGIVCKATNTETNKEVAIKMIDLERCPRIISVLRELQISMYLSLDSKGVSKLIDIQIPATKSGENQWEFEFIGLVFEYMPANLHRIINSDIKMNDDDYRRLLANMLFGLRDLHQANILHRDLKPSNMLVDNRELQNLKICDFGSARAIKKKNQHQMVWKQNNPWSDDYKTKEEGLTDIGVIIEEIRASYTETKGIEEEEEEEEEEALTNWTNWIEEEEEVLTNWTEEEEEALTNEIGTIGYRAPELTLGCEIYSKPADIWAVACVFYEMVTKSLLFKCEGQTNEEQFNAIISKLGSSFITYDLDFIDNKEGKELAKKKREEAVSAPSLTEFIKKDEKGRETLVLERKGIKLLHDMLKFHPGERLTAENALRTPYFSDIYEELKVKYGYPDLKAQIKNDEDQQQSKEKIKEQLWSEMMYFHGYKKRPEPTEDEKNWML